MWITSTYLGKPDAAASAFIYFFWEDYASDKAAPRQLLEYMRRAGNLFEDTATFLAPIEVDTDKISREVNEGRLKQFAKEIQRHAPCLLLTQKNLSDFRPQTDGHIFFGIPDSSASDEDYQMFFAELHRHVADAANSQQTIKDAFLSRIWAALKLSPTICGMGIDLKKLFESKG